MQSDFLDLTKMCVYTEFKCLLYSRQASNLFIYTQLSNLKVENFSIMMVKLTKHYMIT